MQLPNYPAIAFHLASMLLYGELTGPLAKLEMPLITRVIEEIVDYPVPDGAMVPFASRDGVLVARYSRSRDVYDIVDPKTRQVVGETELCQECCMMCPIYNSKHRQWCLCDSCGIPKLYGDRKSKCNCPVIGCLDCTALINKHTLRIFMHHCARCKKRMGRKHTVIK